MSQSSLPAPLRARSRALARWLSVLLAILSLLLLAERFSAAGIALYRNDADAGTFGRFGAQFAAAIPETCYLLALWWIRAALLEFADGAFHTPVIATALRRVGVTLTVGAAVALFLVPGLQRLFGAGPGYLIAYDIGSVALCALGWSLAMLAQVLKRAAEVQSELDEIF